jgi:prepilin-type N-terminal cleavage/methylation domain-containing protein
MTLTPHRPARRQAFSLIELLIVIAIIGILLSLLLAGLSKAFAVVDDVNDKNDVTELHKAMFAFANSAQLNSPGFPPSSLQLPGTLNAGNQSQPGVAYMLRCFPACTQAWSQGQIDWGNGPGAGVTLQGHQALVFFLAGPKQTGWSANALNPGDSTTTRIGPFYAFKASRLIGSPPAYKDVFGTPFAYFNTSVNQSASPATDCAGLGVSPYSQTNGTYYNGDCFQIISAGRNMKFGQNFTSWSTANPYAVNNAGYDDFANFAANKLGSNH